jgi:signal transduction histidine kinase
MSAATEPTNLLAAAGLVVSFILLIGFALVELSIDGADRPVWVSADPDRLAQVFDNVMQNALEAMPDGGVLSVACEVSASPQVERRVQVSFADSGPGVPPDDRARVFEPFFTGRDTGTGLGLAIAREIVEAHGGHLVVSDAAGVGATFSIDLPLGDPSS